MEKLAEKGGCAARVGEEERRTRVQTRASRTSTRRRVSRELYLHRVNYGILVGLGTRFIPCSYFITLIDTKLFEHINKISIIHIKHLKN